MQFSFKKEIPKAESSIQKLCRNDTFLDRCLTEAMSLGRFGFPLAPGRSQHHRPQQTYGVEHAHMSGELHTGYVNYIWILSSRLKTRGPPVQMPRLMARGSPGPNMLQTAPSWGSGFDFVFPPVSSLVALQLLCW